MQHLAALARDAGLRELIAEVLPENLAMLKVFQKSGLNPTTTRCGSNPCDVESAAGTLVGGI
jgi:hypothetical protein